ncbi:hypothetical protein Mapa_016798 [Marchantia paleacea]|nr:hypothetical protein Mapa_016798 [Marchantia paleacea]
MSKVLTHTGESSRFIITSRNREIYMEVDERLTKPDIVELEVSDLQNSRQLFMSYAFPDNDLDCEKILDCVESVVSKCGGLTLSLEILENYFRPEDDEEVWIQAAHALETADNVVPKLETSFWRILMISYNSLQKIPQQLF